MKNKEKFEFPWHYLIIGLLLWFLLYIFFDIPNRFAYQNKGWDIPTDPREKAAYDHAHSIQLPKKVPDGGFVYLKVNESFDPARPAGTKSNPALIKTIIKDFPEPEPFNFAWARFKSFFGVDKSIREQYFNHLCDTEAGEYIYKTVKEVGGIYQMRPMKIDMGTQVTRDRYGFEDPADWHLWEADGVTTEFVNPPFSNFKFFESIISPTKMVGDSTLKKWKVETTENSDLSYFWHYTSELLPKESPLIEDERRIHAKPISIPTAQYAYTWRGIKRPKDRRYSIAGGEMIVLNRETNEVLAFRRSFNLGAHYKGTIKGIAWGGRTCPNMTNGHGLPMRIGMKLNYSYYFINKVFDPLFQQYSNYYKFIREEHDK